MKKNIIFLAATIILLVTLSIQPSFALRILIPLHEQYKKADCVVSAVMLDSHRIKVNNTMWEENISYTLYEFKIKKDIKEGNYGSLVSEIIYVVSQTQPEFLPPHEPIRNSPKFDHNKEYILFLKETPSYYLFSFVQDFRESVEYSEEIVNEIVK